MAKKIIESIKNFFSQAQGELGALRDKISATNMEIEDLESRPIDLPTAQVKLKQGITEIAARFQEDHLKRLPFMNESSYPNSLALNFQDARLFDFMCWLHPDLVEAKMERVLRAFLEQNPGVAPEDRVEKLAELRAILHKLEIDEEDLIREAGEVGMSVARRPDASPEVVLGA